MQKTLAEIANIVEGEVVGDENLVIRGLSGIKEAKEGDLTFVANSKYFSLAKETKASAIITPRDMEVEGKAIIRTDNPSYAFSKVAALVVESEIDSLEGIHETAVISKEAKLADGVAVGPHVVIEANADIGANTKILAGSFIGTKAKLGSNCLIYPNVTIRERVEIGNHVLIHSGTVIGSDGFGFELVEGVHEKIPQLGTVLVEDNVEIGANVTIDRARFDKTLIGRGTKVDNLVQIGHNVQIGENCILVSLVGVSGSVNLEKGVILAGQAGITGHLTIGEGTVVAAKSGVTKSIPANSKVSGFPARPHTEVLRVNAAVNKLPEYLKTIQDLEERVKELESKLKDG